MRTHAVTLYDGTRAVSAGRVLYLLDGEDGRPEMFPGVYRVRQMDGVAWRVHGAEIEYYNDGCEDGAEWRETGRVVAVMVGDDARHTFDPEDLEPIAEEDYCGVCGQIGCTHDGRERGGE